MNGGLGVSELMRTRQRATSVCALARPPITAFGKGGGGISEPPSPPHRGEGGWGVGGAERGGGLRARCWDPRGHLGLFVLVLNDEDALPFLAVDGPHDGPVEDQAAGARVDVRVQLGGDQRRVVRGDEGLLQEQNGVDRGLAALCEGGGGGGETKAD